MCGWNGFGSSKTGGVGWLTRKWTTLPLIRSGRSQWLFDESRKISSSAGEYQSAGAAVLRVVGEQGAGHVLPAEELERPHLVAQDRVLRVDDHAEVAREA